ncbi:ACT domain-containing protein [Yoonia sp.]|uniref:ACT domain-containing protein n=1 Tax=Yoonia sp. TaxID=2212373 RepID=UPI00238F7855|nr:ACT domain-containing protein [Yoonia sp.]MDE0850207.1 ACT domain-containing protein [Yoonia sp.]
MTGETDLNTLLRSLKADLIDGIFVFVTVPTGQIPPDLAPRMMFQEAEGTTLVLLKDAAHAADLPYEFPSRMITLNIHSSLDAVGFMARIATALGNEGMGVNPVAGFYHDHLFVPNGREQDALRILSQIAKDAAG